MDMTHMKVDAEAVFPSPEDDWNDQAARNMDTEVLYGSAEG